MLSPDPLRFPSCSFDGTALIISYGAIFHLEISPMPELSLLSELSSVSSPFFRSPYDIGEAENLPEDISSLA